MVTINDENSHLGLNHNYEGHNDNIFTGARSTRNISHVTAYYTFVLCNHVLCNSLRNHAIFVTEMYFWLL